MKRDFLSLKDLTRAEIELILKEAARLKAERKSGGHKPVLAGRTVGLIFNKPSTRTRVSFEVGVYELGGRVVYLSDPETGFGRREPIPHGAKVLSRYLDALVIRTFAQADIELFARSADVPVINALTDQYHPCQVLSDLFTIAEVKGERLEDLRIAWVGDGNNMAHSWLNAAAIMGFELALATPEKYRPDPQVLAYARERATRPITLTSDPVEAVRGADVVNTDVWASMGQEAQAAERAAHFRGYQINAGLLAQAAPAAIVLHCLPAHLGEEITEEVLEGPQSVVFDQAENRLHAQKALLGFLMAGGAG
ncbi:MAG: ornithine carbamoyltransferase [Thermodesulfobacteriota bacterium]